MTLVAIGRTIGAVALLLVGAWVTLLVATSRRAYAGDAVEARRLNRSMLLAAVLASVATCAAPVVPLVAAFQEIVDLPPAERDAAIEVSIASIRTLQGIALLSIPILVAGAIVFVSNRRQLARRSPGGTPAS